MSSNNGTYVEDLPFATNTDYRDVYGQVVDRTNGNESVLTTNGNTLPVTSNQGSSNNLVAYNQFDGNPFYDGVGSLFNQKLILPKELRTSYDIRYKTDYFPRGGKHVGKPQSPRYLLTVDDEQDIIVRFQRGCTVPQNLDVYFLEVSLITVPRADINAMDSNPYFIPLTAEQLEAGEIAIKLVPVKTHKSDLKNIGSLRLFNGQTPSDSVTNCQTIKALEETYQLSHARIAFSFGYRDANDQFIRFPNTTVISNEIIEKEKPKPLNNITCPNCSHPFNIKEQKQQDKKRSASSTKSPKKKRVLQCKTHNQP